MENNDFLIWSGLIVMVIIAVLLVPAILAKSQRQVTSVEVCSTHTVQPVVCKVIESEEGIPKKIGVQMAEPYITPNGELYSLRAAVGANYADLKKGDATWPKEKDDIYTTEIVGTSENPLPRVSQVVVYSVYLLPDDSTSSCKSIPMTCVS